jgi:hypothetical protein
MKIVTRRKRIIREGVVKTKPFPEREKCDIFINE